MILILINLALISLFLFWLFLLVFQRKIPRKSFHPDVSIIAAVYNEKETLPRFLESLEKAGYPGNMEIIIVDDGSTDGSTDGLKASAIIIKTKHRGKCHALNTGLRKAKYDVLLVADADIVVPPGAIEKVVAPLSGKKVGLVSGKVNVFRRGILSWFQRVEYAMTSALLHAHSSFGISLPFVYGAFTAIQKKALEDIGGFQCGTLIEDSDTYVSLLEAGYKIVGSEAVVLTEPAAGFRELFLQRLRWMKGGIQLFFKHWRSFFRGGSLTYMLALFILWPIGTFVTLALNVPEFLKWWQWVPSFFVPYTVNWVTFIGPWVNLFNLPSWGFPIEGTTGILIGVFSSLTVLASQVRENKEFGFGELIAFICFPLYAWVFMGLVGLFAVFGFIIDVFRGH
ncbi:MAG: glycosyltransferase family 2 protein [Candidatus Diapherotrites archaeon]|nr:glycosyltransferase family 2 protein [Candidatus Diapherotrites archaeon]